MKVIACGSRSWTDSLAVLRRLRALPVKTTVVHGASPGGGADYYIDASARALEHEVVPVPISDADRQRGTRRQAPIFRNLRIYDEHPDAELVLAFWDGASPGTKHMLDEAGRRGIPTEVIL